MEELRVSEVDFEAVREGALKLNLMDIKGDADNEAIILFFLYGDVAQMVERSLCMRE
ncbi:hypothetical protein A2U01_0014393, partial [Trifolium medium]|nr:hypothetical protein [Trifolium medium]